MHCKEWKQASLIDSHQKSCPYKEEKPSSLLATLNFASTDAKAKRLKAFKQQVKEFQERNIDPVDAADVTDP